MNLNDKLKNIISLRKPAEKFFFDIISLMCEIHSDEKPDEIVYAVDNDFIIFIKFKNNNNLMVSYDNMFYYLEEYYNMNFIEGRIFILNNCKRYLNWNFDIEDIKLIK